MIMPLNTVLYSKKSHSDEIDALATSHARVKKGTNESLPSDGSFLNEYAATAVTRHEAILS